MYRMSLFRIKYIKCEVKIAQVFYLSEKSKNFTFQSIIINYPMHVYNPTKLPNKSMIKHSRVITVVRLDVLVPSVT